MDRKTVFTKTAKGLMEAAGKTSLVGREVRNVLTLVDGKSTVGDLQLKLDIPERKLNAHIATLVREVLIREFVIAPASITPASEASVQDHSLDFGKLIPRDTSREEAQHSAEVDAIAREIIAAAQAREEKQAAAVPAPPPPAPVIPAPAAATSAAGGMPEIQGPASEVDPIAAFRVRADLTLREAERRVQEDAAKARANLQAKKDLEMRQRREAEEARRLEEDRKRLDEERRRAEADRLKNMQAAERAKREAEEAARRADEARQLRERDEVEKRARAERAAEEMRIQREASRRSSVVRGAPQAAPNPPEARGAAGANARNNNNANEDARRKAREEDRAKAKAQAELAAKARKEARAREIADAEARAIARTQEREREAALVASRLQNIRDGVPRGSVGRIIVLVIALILALAILVVPLIPIDVSRYEALAAERLGMQAKIGNAAYALFPLPHLRLREVKVGDTAFITEVKARPQLASLWSDPPVFSEVELVGVDARPAVVGALLWGRMPSETAMPARLSVRDLRLEGMGLPALQATVDTDAAGSRVVKLVDQSGNINVRLTRQGEGAVFEFYARDGSKVLPFGLPVEELNVRGTADTRSVQASSFDARMMDGNMKGKAVLTWAEGWTLVGDLEAIQLDAARFSPSLGGRFRGSGNFRVQAQNWPDMKRGFRLTGNFDIEKGQINGLDLVRSVREGELALGKTSFSSLRGEGTADLGKLDLRNIRIDAGLLSAQGSATLIDKEVNGRVAVEMRSAAGPMRGNFNLSGSPDQLQAAP